MRPPSKAAWNEDKAKLERELGETQRQLVNTTAEHRESQKALWKTTGALEELRRSVEKKEKEEEQRRKERWEKGKAKGKGAQPSQPR